VELGKIALAEHKIAIGEIRRASIIAKVPTIPHIPTIPC
jgi:hypothetical protein